MANSTPPDALVYTDGETGYIGLPNHEAVKHTVGEFVRGQAHTNGIELGFPIWLWSFYPSE